MNQSD